MSEWTVDTLKEHMDKQFEMLLEAVNKADAAYEKRMDTTNEWRDALNDQQSTFVTKESVRWAIGALIVGLGTATAIFAAINGAG